MTQAPLLALLATATFAHADSAVLPIFEFQNQAPIEIDSGSAQTNLALGSFFKAEEIDDQVVRFIAEYDDGTGLIRKNIDMAMFSNRTPVTRTNFLQYVSDGDYVDSFIHRSAVNFVIQGGGFKFDTTPEGTSVVPVQTDPPIVNEPGISNTLGTISMAKTAASPDTATSQFFVSTAANSANLDYQNGGFTVFARITKQTLPNSLLFNNTSEFPIYDITSLVSGPFNSVPLHNTIQGTLLIEKFITFRSVDLVPLPADQAGTDTSLTHIVATQPAASLASASINGTNLVIQPTGSTTGSGSLSVTATDSVGNTVTGLISILVGPSYATWRSANFTSPDLADDNISGPNADPDGNGITNLQAFSQGLSLTETVSPTFVHNTNDVRLTYLEQTDSIGTNLIIERSTSLSDDWTEVEATTISSNPTAKAKQESVTVSVPKSGTKAFYRVRFELVGTPD